jgi:serine/threonine protein kinase
MQNKVKFD